MDHAEEVHVDDSSEGDEVGDARFAEDHDAGVGDDQIGRGVGMGERLEVFEAGHVASRDGGLGAAPLDFAGGLLCGLDVDVREDDRPAAFRKGEGEGATDAARRARDHRRRHRSVRPK